MKIFADGADLAKMREMADDPRIAGFTTNPTLMRKAGVSDYRAFAREALAIASGRPVSFEVFADDHDGIGVQAREISAFDPARAFVKVPVIYTSGVSTRRVVRELSAAGIALNVTAVFTPTQVSVMAEELNLSAAPAIISVFAGRIADAGVDPVQHMESCAEDLDLHCPRAGVELLWASPRQVYDYKLAERAGCDIITMTPDLIAKLALFGKDLDEYSLETVKMFHEDAKAAGYTL